MRREELAQEGRQGQRKWRPTILAYLVLMNSVLLCLLFPTITIYLFKQEKDFQSAHLEHMISQMRSSLEQHSSSIAHNLALSAGQAMAGFNFTFLNTMVEDVVNNDRQIVYCYVMDTSQKILAHNDTSQIGTVLVDQNAVRVAAMRDTVFQTRLSGNKQPVTVDFIEFSPHGDEEGSRILEAVAPVYSGANLVGFLRCGFSLQDLDTEITKVKKDWAGKIYLLKVTFSAISLLFLIVGALVAFIFTGIFVRSVRLLSDGVDKIARGDLGHSIRPQGMVCSEFTRLSSSFNMMTEKLRVSYEQLEMYSKNLEQKVTERTRELKAAQAELLQQAHDAGMAEMAMGILHNIGNAITPAKVRNSLLLDKINRSMVRNNIAEIMRKSTEMLADSGSFSSAELDRQMKILSLLPETVEDEFAHIGDEIGQIQDKHEHIEAIIHLQMRYARLATASEEINANEVITDALEMLDDTIKMRGIMVTEELLESPPPIRMEKPKLLQVLINLIKNAIEAMVSTAEGHRRLLVSTKVVSGETEELMISVCDAGAGFTEDTKKDLFTYGYTTKVTGSGFGLHSCANFLIAHKGRIEAHSEGPGKGARFDIYIPVSRKEKS